MKSTQWLPMEMAPIRMLIKKLDSMETRFLHNRIIEEVTQQMRYPDAVPQNRHTGSGVIGFHREDWNTVYFRGLPNGQCLFIKYAAQAAWAYRGFYTVESDLFGQHSVVVYDELKAMFPIWSKFSVDTNNKINENIQVPGH